jgi:hypothetical protein
LILDHQNRKSEDGRMPFMSYSFLMTRWVSLAAVIAPCLLMSLVASSQSYVVSWIYALAAIAMIPLALPFGIGVNLLRLGWPWTWSFVTTALLFVSALAVFFGGKRSEGIDKLSGIFWVLLCEYVIALLLSTPAVAAAQPGGGKRLLFFLILVVPALLTPGQAWKRAGGGLSSAITDRFHRLGEKRMPRHLSEEEKYSLDLFLQITPKDLNSGEINSESQTLENALKKVFSHEESLSAIRDALSQSVTSIECRRTGPKQMICTTMRVNAGKYQQGWEMHFEEVESGSPSIRVMWVTLNE